MDQAERGPGFPYRREWRELAETANSPLSVGPKTILALLDALGAALAERDAALERERMLREALAALSLATEHLQNAIRDGFSDHEWHEEYAGNMLDDAMLECDEALGTADEARAALAATATSEEEQA